MTPTFKQLPLCSRSSVAGQSGCASSQHADVLPPIQAQPVAHTHAPLPNFCMLCWCPQQLLFLLTHTPAGAGVGFFAHHCFCTAATGWPSGFSQGGDRLFSQHLLEAPLSHSDHWMRMKGSVTLPTTDLVWGQDFRENESSHIWPSSFLSKLSFRLVSFPFKSFIFQT